jgi:hypothetical protein
MTQRRRLLNRRPSETFGFRWRDMNYTATTSRFPDGGLAEIFLSGAKMNTDSDAIARDGGVIASIALQFGAEVEAVRGPRRRGKPVGRRTGSDCGDESRQWRERAMKIAHPLWRVEHLPNSRSVSASEPRHA